MKKGLNREKVRYVIKSGYAGGAATAAATPDRGGNAGPNSAGTSTRNQVKQEAQSISLPPHSEWPGALLITVSEGCHKNPKIRSHLYLCSESIDDKGVLPRSGKFKWLKFFGINSSLPSETATRGASGHSDCPE